MSLSKRTSVRFIRLALPALALLSASAAAAQTTPPPLQVVSVSPATVTMGSRLQVTFRNLSSVGTAADVQKHVLYLNGYPLKGITAEAATRDQLTFYLERTDEAQAAWSALLGNASSTPRPVRVGIGLPDQREIGQPDGVAAVTVNLRAYTQGAFTAGGVVVAVALLVFLGLAMNTGIIRDRTAASVAVKDRPYSLARFQMAVWFFVILGSMLYIAIVMRYVVMTQQALILLGIATATQLGGAMVDQTRQGADAAPATRTEGLFRDLVTDENGVSLHRFQMLVWTLVLASFFAIGVYGELTMPVFSTEVLALMGISGGTYVTFKIYERPSDDAAKAKAEAEEKARAEAEANAKAEADAKAAEEAKAREEAERINVGPDTPIVDGAETPAQP